MKSGLTFSSKNPAMEPNILIGLEIGVAPRSPNEDIGLHLLRFA